jgi:lipopolysaccharide/colanic/teichoic acid biosynthesis glycosyltransferase
VKRLFDIFASAVGLVVLSPLLLLVALLVLVDVGLPIFFRQQRPGLHGRPFELVKFRTMRAGSAAGSGVDSDALRLTRIGRLLRALSLDELPELWNVLKGEMSLVGPRPLLMQYLDRYTPEQARRHEVRPGLTGWAQVNGRNALSWEEKFALDIWYVDHRSFLLDLRIMLLTAWSLIRPRGVSAEGEATMTEFMGTSLPERTAETARNGQDVETGR